MIEKIILDHLASCLRVPVYLEHRPDEPDSFVLIERIGSSRDNMITTVSFAIQSYGASMLEACRLNEEVKEAMDRSIELNSISRVSLDTDYNFTDTETKRYRYQAIYDLVLF